MFNLNTTINIKKSKCILNIKKYNFIIFNDKKYYNKKNIK